MVRRSSRSRSKGRELYQVGSTMTTPKTAEKKKRTPRTPKSDAEESVEPKMQFSVGDAVMAKWPGSKLFYSAKIQTVRESDEEFDVEYENGIVFTVKAKDVLGTNTGSFRKAVRANRSKSKTRGRSKSRSKKNVASKRIVDQDYSTFDESTQDVTESIGKSSKATSSIAAFTARMSGSSAKNKAVTDVFSEDEDAFASPVEARVSSTSKSSRTSRSSTKKPLPFEEKISSTSRSTRGSRTPRTAIDSFSDSEEAASLLLSVSSNSKTVDGELELATDQTALAEESEGASSGRASISSRISAIFFGNTKDKPSSATEESIILADDTEAASFVSSTVSVKKRTTSSKITNGSATKAAIIEEATTTTTTTEKGTYGSEAGEAGIVLDLAAQELSSFPYLGRRSSRASTKADTKASQSNRRQSTGLKSSPPPLDEFSEDEEKIEQPVEKLADKTTEVGAGGRGEWIWAIFFMIICPAILVSLHSMCTANICALAIPVLSVDPRDYFDPTAMIMLLSFICVLRILEFICMGREVQGYRMNGFQTLMLILTIVPVMVYNKVPLTMVTSKYFHLMCATIFLSFGQALFSILASFWAVGPEGLSNKGNSSNILVNFFHGRELHPRLLGANLKLQTFRASMIGLALLNTFLVAEVTENLSTANPTVILAATLQVLYALDAMWYEEGYFYSHDYIHSGYGWSLISSYLTFPFLPTLTTRYLVSRQPTLDWTVLSAIALLNLIGYWIYRSSENQRCQLARDPGHPSLASLEVKQTSAGRRLITSGWWGIVRHPNYLGELLIQWSWVIPAIPSLGLGELVPYYLPVITTLMLIVRCLQINKRNSRKFGPVWTEYSERVKSNILPFVF